MVAIIDQALAKVQKISLFQRTVTNHDSTGPLNGWQGQGEGHVSVQAIDNTAFYLQETGTFRLANGTFINIHNEWLWRFAKEHIQLGHTRYGREQPVELVTLIPDATEQQLVTLTPHQCGKDDYRATMTLEQGIRLYWSIQGPKKASTITDTYLIPAQ